MSYSRTIAFANVLYGIKVPQAAASRSAPPSSATCMRPTKVFLQVLKERNWKARPSCIDFEKFWEMMRRRKKAAASAVTEAQAQGQALGFASRLPYPSADAAQGAVRQSGYAVRIKRAAGARKAKKYSDFLFEHQVQPEYRYTFHWQEGDVLIWRTSERSTRRCGTYGPHEHRLIKRCQVHGRPIFRRGLKNEIPALAKLLVATLLTTFAAVAAAQPYPSKPVRVIVGFAAGGPTDVIARVMAQDMSASLRQGFIVENP